MSGTPPSGFWEQAAAWAEEYAVWARQTPRRPRGIWFSELFAFLTACRLFRVGSIIESGIHLGQSSEAIQRWHIGRHCGIDRHVVQLPRPGTIEVFLFDRYGGRVAVLLDGPKDVAAVELAEEALALGVSLVGIHDMYELPGEAREARYRLSALGPSWFTDDTSFVRRYQELDGPVSVVEDPRVGWLDESRSGKLPYFLVSDGSRFRAMLSYGPTLGLTWQGSDGVHAALPELPAATERAHLAHPTGVLRVPADVPPSGAVRTSYVLDSYKDI